VGNFGKILICREFSLNCMVAKKTEKETKMKKIMQPKVRTDF